MQKAGAHQFSLQGLVPAAVSDNYFGIFLGHPFKIMHEYTFFIVVCQL